MFIMTGVFVIFHFIIIMIEIKSNIRLAWRCVSCNLIQRVWNKYKYFGLISYSVPKPVFATKKTQFRQQQQHVPEEVLSPQHEELVKYIHECKLFLSR